MTMVLPGRLLPFQHEPGPTKTVRAWSAILVLGLAVLAGSMRVACARTLTLAQYDQRLAAVQTAADAYALHPPPSAPAPAGASGTAGASKTAVIQAALAPVLRCAVLVPGPAGTPGDLLIVDNRPTLTTLKWIDREKKPARRNQLIAGLRDQLSFLRAQAQAAAVQDTKGRQGAQIARIVLSSHEFSSDPIPPPSYFQRQMDKFAPWFDREMKALGRLFHFRPGPTLPDLKIDPRVPEGILITIVIIAGGLLIAFIARLVTETNWAKFRQARLSAAETGLALTAEEAALVAARDFDQLLALARQRADGGDCRSAFRLVYLATLVTLDQQGIVRLNKSRTNWEYLRTVRQTGNDALYAALLPMTRGFDRIWYGLHPATRADYEQALTEHAALRGQAGVS